MLYKSQNSWSLITCDHPCFLSENGSNRKPCSSLCDILSAMLWADEGLSHSNPAKTQEDGEHPNMAFFLQGTKRTQVVWIEV